MNNTIFLGASHLKMMYSGKTSIHACGETIALWELAAAGVLYLKPESFTQKLLSNLEMLLFKNIK